MPARMNTPGRMNPPQKSAMFPHTVTLYNVQTELDADFNERATNHITILRGVLLDASKAVNVRASGLEGADAVNLYIPFSVMAADGVSGRSKKYAGPLEFWRSEDKSELWTLSTGGDTFFVKGIAVEPDANAELIEMKYDGVYTVTKVDEKDFGSLMHWEVGGN